jgi:cyclopropane-fatty-acyl-phospholipid synthase
MKSKETVKSLLALADIKIDGTRPFDIQVHDDRFYSKVLRSQSLGLGEAYMDGWWDCDAIDEMIAKIVDTKLLDNLSLNLTMVGGALAGSLINLQTKTKARKNASAHYDIGNDLYRRMLGEQMIYSCAYWKDTTTLVAAQAAKLDLICRKLHLKPGMTLLDIGCGWGGFLEYAAKKYGIIGTGITPAHEQVTLAKQRVKNLSVTILQQDYREIAGSFDRIVSIGALEHIGPKNYKAFFKQCSNLLSPHGLMLHHTIGLNVSASAGDPWMNKYIFPGGVAPSLTQISRAVECTFIIEDIENFGPYYDKTLMAWHANFVKSYPEIKARYDKRFCRMWKFYLLLCAGDFRARDLQLWQIVMRKIERSATYQGIR